MKSRIMSFGKWTTIAIVIGVLAGTASAWFLHALDWATKTREENPLLLWFLPVAGFAVGWVYHRFGKSVERGNNLIIDEIHSPKTQVPLRMTPLILIGTVITHFCGGSAGREGTAVQMGASLADQITRVLKLGPEDRRTLLMAGMSGGFGSVFGVPMAGTVFGMEALTVGKVHVRNFWECLIASFVGHYVCLAWGVHHTHYAAPDIAALTPASVVMIVLAGASFGLVATAFSFLQHETGRQFKKHIAYPPLRPLIGGAVVILIYFMLGTNRYAGLGVPIIQDSLLHPLPPADFAWKTVLTALTLGSGFKGGEVTPLLFIGATLGNALAVIVSLPLSLLAAVGFVAVFAGAANTPWACTLMAIEIFGPQVGVYALIGCWVSFFCSSQSGIYAAQKAHAHKRHRLHKVFRLGK